MNTVTSRDGTRIAYDATGEGPVVILIGGAFSYRRFPKSVQLAELLAEQFTVINYDRRGRGDSGDNKPHSVTREVEDLDAMIAANGGSASLWGWSSGAVLAVRAAAAGLPVERLALYEPPFLVDDSRPLPAADFEQRLDALVHADRRGDAVKLYMTEGMGAPSFFVNAMRLLPVWSRLKAVAHTLPYDWAILGDTISGKPLTPAWRQVTAPTLVMAGEKSPLQLRNAAQALADILPFGTHRLLAGQSHNPSMKAQAPFIADFLGTNRRPDAALAQAPSAA
jgi:pimeloyl-ACP methyl ester carboxylesterase